MTGLSGPPCRVFSLGLVVLGLAAAPRLIHAQATGAAAITGRITDAVTGQPIAGVLVELEGHEVNALSDSTGRYLLLRMPAGPQVLRTERLGYAAARIAIVVPARGTLQHDVALAASALRQEAIVVTADPVSRARGELGTATVIGRDAIANQVATSLSGVLELVAGVPLAAPGVSGVQQIQLRAAATTAAVTTSELASFGTLIIMDGVPLSNNANLQRLPAGTTVTVGAGGGVDLRRVPASTLERVEVIRGVPSARYSDLTQGAIVVETRTGAIDPELAIQADPQTVNASLVAGRALGGAHAGAVLLDLTRQRPQAGVRDDEAHRLAVQLKHRGELWKNGEDAAARLVLDTRANAIQVLDDRPVMEGDVREIAMSSRDRGWRISERARLLLARGARLELTASLEALRQSTKWQSMRTSGAMPFTDRLTEGRATGRFIAGQYLSRLELEGAPRLAYGRLEYQLPSRWLGLDHELRAGVEARREWNSGPGYQFDMATPPQISSNGIEGFDRPRPYDAIPAMALSALYLDHRLSRGLGAGVLSLQAGLRADVLHAGSSWFSATRDAVLEPRLNLEFGPAGWVRLRGGWGRVAKSPSTARLYPEPRYFDVVNVNWYAARPEERLAVLTTFIREATNPDLAFAVVNKADAGIELGGGNWAVSLVAFRDAMANGFGTLSEAQWVRRDRYEVTDSTPGTGLPPRIIEPSTAADTIPVLLARPENNVDLRSHGLELTAFLPELPGLHTRLQVQAQWIESRQEASGPDFGSSSRFQDFQFLYAQRRLPFWDAPVRSGRRALATYRIVHHQPELGLVLTGTIQHNLFDRVWDRGAADTLAFAGYITREGVMTRVPAAGRTRPEYHDLRVPRSTSLTELRKTPADWLLSLQVRKTLPFDGHVSFWVFNALDRPGYLLEADVQPRPYASTRFGLELVQPLHRLLGR